MEVKFKLSKLNQRCRYFEDNVPMCQLRPEWQPGELQGEGAQAPQRLPQPEGTAGV